MVGHFAWQSTTRRHGARVLYVFLSASFFLLLVFILADLLAVQVQVIQLQVCTFKSNKIEKWFGLFILFILTFLEYKDEGLFRGAVKTFWKNTVQSYHIGSTCTGVGHQVTCGSWEKLFDKKEPGHHSSTV